MNNDTDTPTEKRLRIVHSSMTLIQSEPIYITLPGPVAPSTTYRPATRWSWMIFFSGIFLGAVLATVLTALILGSIFVGLIPGVAVDNTTAHTPSAIGTITTITQARGVYYITLTTSELTFALDDSSIGATLHPGAAIQIGYRASSPGSVQQITWIFISCYIDCKSR